MVTAHAKISRTFVHTLGECSMFQLRLYGTPVLINVNIFIIFNTHNKGIHICVR